MDHEIKFTQEMRDVFARAGISYVATVCADGSPNLSPKATMMIYDDEHLIFMDQDSPGTMANLRQDPRLEVNTIDVFRRRGWRFKGTAKIHSPGSKEFEWLKEKLLGIIGSGYPMNEAVTVRVEKVLPVLSPAYKWGDGKPEELAPVYLGRYLKASGVSREEIQKILDEWE